VNEETTILIDLTTAGRTSRTGAVRSSTRTRQLQGMRRDCSTAMKPAKSGFMAAPSPSIEPQSVESEAKSVESLT